MANTFGLYVVTEQEFQNHALHRVQKDLEVRFLQHFQYIGYRDSFHIFQSDSYTIHIITEHATVIRGYIYNYILFSNEAIYFLNLEKLENILANFMPRVRGNYKQEKTIEEIWNIKVAAEKKIREIIKQNFHQIDKQ